MNKSCKINIFIITFILSLILITPVISACDNTSTSSNTPTPPVTPPTSSPNQPPTSDPADSPSATSIKVDILYFHRPQRCPSCLCFEERVTYVINNYFQNELSSGKLTFAVLNAGEPKNAELVKKYKAVGTQLFINVVKNGTDNIKDIQEIWDWGCRQNKDAFDQKIKDLIGQSLTGQI